MQKVTPYDPAIALDSDYLFDLLPCYLTVQDRELKIVKTNAFLRAEFGDHVGERCYRAYKGRPDICPGCCVEKTFADGQMHQCEEVIRKPDGTLIDVMVYTSPLRNKEGEIVAVMEMFSDIGEVKRLQRKLEKSQKEYKRFFDLVPCYISIQDRDFRIIQANNLFRRDFGDHIGDYCYSVYKGRESVCPDCCVKATFSDGQVHSREETVETKDRRQCNVITYTSPIHDREGRVVAVMEMFTDITDVKRLQKELILMGESVASMAHGIKNILTGLEGGIYVVGSGLSKHDEVLVQTGWGMVENNVTKVSRLVKDLLYCSREREPDYQLVEPNKIAREVHELFRKKADTEGFSLRLELDDSLEKIPLDPEAIHAVLVNLVTNAIDACKFDTKKIDHVVTLRTRQGDGSTTVFEVVDNGKGIPSAWQGRLFENSFSSKGGKGTGLGLLVSRKIVGEHGGEITFDSVRGVGTSFRVRLPQTPPEKSEMAAVWGDINTLV